MVGVTTAGMRYEPPQTAKRDMVSGDRNERTCRQCGKIITTGQRRKYCSQECMVVSRRVDYRKMYANNPEKIRKARRMSRKNNIEKFREASRTRYKNNKEKVKEINRRWYLKNKDMISRKHKQFKKDNPEIYKKKTKEYYLNNKKKLNERSRKWRKDNPEKARELNRKNRERVRRKADGDSIQVSHTVRDISAKTPSKHIQAGKHSIEASGNVKRACKRCGKAITTKWYKKYCSQECRVKSTSEHSQKLYKNNPDKFKKNTRTWQKDNPEKYMESRRRSNEKRRRKAMVARGVIKRTCRQCGKAITTWRRKAYCSQECSVVGRMEYPRKRYANNPEKAIEISKRWRKNNPEKAMENGKQWRRNNLEKAREIGRRSDEKRRIKARVARGVIKRACRQCGKVITAWRRKAYCSQACSVVSNMECARKRRANNPEKARENSRRGNEKRRIKTMLARNAIKRTCRQCGNMITAWRRKAYCSQECSVVGYKEYNMKRQADNLEKYRDNRRRREERRRKIIKENTERWVENYMAKVREGARIEREAEGKNTGDRRTAHMVGGMQMGDESV